MKVKILKSAGKNLVAGYKFYETQQKGLGKTFLNILMSDIESLEFYAGIHQIHFNDYYRLLSHRFPYAIYYKIIKDEVRIYLVVDCRRNPELLKRNLK